MYLSVRVIFSVEDFLKQRYKFVVIVTEFYFPFNKLGLKICFPSLRLTVPYVTGLPRSNWERKRLDRQLAQTLTRLVTTRRKLTRICIGHSHLTHVHFLSNE